MPTSDKIFLIGMPGCGKSTLGRELAKETGLTFIDLDKEIEQHEQLSIPEIFNRHGEDHFRQVESKLLKKFATDNSSFIMATGGGAPCFHSGIEEMLNAGKTIFVDVPLEALLERLDTSNRPKFDSSQRVEEQLKSLYAKRWKTYKKATITITGAKITVEDLLERI